jgi:hypothetical protein
MPKNCRDIIAEINYACRAAAESRSVLGAQGARIALGDIRAYVKFNEAALGKGGAEVDDLYRALELAEFAAELRENALRRGTSEQVALRREAGYER